MSQLLPIVGPNSPEATNSIIIIQKVRLKDLHLTCEFTEQRCEDAPARAFALTCQEQVHADLLHRLSRLVPHLCLLAEQLTEAPDFWPDEAEELPALFGVFSVTGFSMGKNQSGVTLLGQRELTGGRVLNLTSPYQSFEDEHNRYPYAGRLETALFETIAEVKAALRGKCTEYRQLDLFEQQESANLLVVSTRPEA